jgi:hypothetical protein
MRLKRSCANSALATVHWRTRQRRGLYELAGVSWTWVRLDPDEVETSA